MFKWIPAVVAAVCLYTIPAKASGNLTPGETQLVKALSDAGVELYVQPCEDDSIYGAYSSQYNAILICNNVADSISQRWETLRHEAIHVAQRCVNPAMTNMVHSQAYIEYYAHESDLEAIARNYDPEDWAIEAEAFTLMRRSNQYVAEVVNKACNI